MKCALGSAIFLTITCMMSVTSLADYFNCAPGQLGKAPELRQKTYEIIFSSKCTLEQLAERDRNLSDLNRLLISNVISKLKIKSQALAENFNGLSGVRIDATETSTDLHGDRLSIESIYHLATDGRDKLFYKSESLAIQGTGDSSHLRKNDIAFNVIRKSSVKDKKQIFELQITRLTEIEKPWYAPMGIFRAEVEKNVRQDFNESVSEQAKEISNYLNEQR